MGALCGVGGLSREYGIENLQQTRLCGARSGSLRLAPMMYASKVTSRMGPIDYIDQVFSMPAPSLE